MKKFLRDTVVVLLITFVGVEVGLRFAPNVIPLALLIKFSPNTRAEIAERRNLPTKRRTMQVHRDDSGPPLRVLQPYQNVGNFFADQGMVSSVTTDENEFCNAPIEETADRKVGFVAVGDSFTWCTAVRPQDTWVSQLAKLTAIEGYNLGLGGVGVYEYLQLLMRYGLQWRPNRVLLNYYEGNDLRDALNYRHFRDYGADDLAEKERTGVIAKAKQTVRRVFGMPLVGDSYALNLALAFVREAYLLMKEVSGAGEHTNFRYYLEFPEGRVALNVENTDLDEVKHARALKEDKISLSVLEEGLVRFVGLADKYGFEPFVLYTPSAYTVYADYLEFEDRDVAELMPWFSWAQRDFLRVKSQTLGYRFVDLTPALRRAARTYRGDALLYFPTNVHLSQLGHEIVARELADVLATESRSISPRIRRLSESFSVGPSFCRLYLRDANWSWAAEGQVDGLWSHPSTGGPGWPLGWQGVCYAG